MGIFFMNEHPIFGKIIYTYTTREAVADGTLVKVDSKISQKAGIKYPVYLTRAVYEKYVCVPEELSHEQDHDGRLWDILFVFAFRAKVTSGNSLTFNVIVRLPNKGDWKNNEKRCADGNQRQVKLHAVITARDFDDPSPAIFIMKPGED
jgi:hypothetical protein